MLGYRKRSLYRAHAMLQALRADPADLVPLTELQRLLLREIMRAEEKIRELKHELRATDGSATGPAAERSPYLARRIEGFRECTYIWRCFGDAIAFLYMDKHALKHTFYSTETINAKQGAGFIAGKEGLANELSLLESALKHGVPALTVDLTNTIRHGDICLMAEDDPHLIEVKASKSLNRKRRKQKRSLEKLRSFYDTDRGVGLRGFAEVRRRVYKAPERSYVDQVNECIVEALENGYAARQPELGLHFVVVRRNGPDLVRVLERLGLKVPWIFYLNMVKSARTWAPYLPFTLTIEKAEHLWDFIRGNLFILMVVEMDTLCQIVMDKGYHAELYPDDELYPMRIAMPGIEGTAGVSAQFLSRIGMEFVSPDWLMQTSVELLEEGISERAPTDSGAPIILATEV